MESLLPIFIIGSIVAGSYTCALAGAKGYNRILWFLGGLLFNIIALITIAGIPSNVRELENINKRIKTDAIKRSTKNGVTSIKKHLYTD